MPYTFKLRRESALRWAAADPILADGEPGFEHDTGRFKIGNGQAKWSELEYFVPEGGGNFPDPDPGAGSTLTEHIDSSLPHPVYDSGPSLNFLYENAKV